MVERRTVRAHRGPSLAGCSLPRTSRTTRHGGPWMTTAPVAVGNPSEDSTPSRGWRVGLVVKSDDGAIRKSDAVEVRWTSFPAGTERAEWVRGEVRTTIVLLVSGHFRILCSAEP